MLPGLRANLNAMRHFLTRGVAERGLYQPVFGGDVDEDAAEREGAAVGGVAGAINTFRTRFGPLASSVLFLSTTGSLFFVLVLSESFSTSVGYQAPTSPAPVINASNASTVMLVTQNATTVGWLAVAPGSAATPAVSPVSPASSHATKRLDTRFYLLMSLGLLLLLVAVVRTLLVMRRIFTADSRRNAAGASAAALARSFGASRSGNGNHNFEMALTELASFGAFRNLRGQLSMMQRELTANDFEMLSQLDNANPSASGGPPGASEALINRMPLHHMTASEIATKTESNALTCSICLAPFEVGALVRTVVCMHSFHKTCIDPWLRMRSSCPVCKIPITADGGV